MTYSTQQPFSELQYCIRCCMPETNEGIEFDELGYCTACQASEQKMHINWAERRRELEKILENAKQKAGDNYDCIIPISGGKDSTFQLHLITKVFNMKPLAVTFSHNWFSKIGFYNLMNALEKFNVDHIMYTPNRALVNKLAKHSLYGVGDSCWHCHSGVGSFPLHIATKFKIPLLIWGESLAEMSGRGTHFNPIRKFDREYFTKVSAKLTPTQMKNDELSSKDLFMFNLPTAKECEDVALFGIHLGDYVFWDDERQVEFLIKEYDWKETEIEGAYKRYKSAECIMPGVHDATCYLKRGFGRATWQASVDVRNGIMTREEGFKLINEVDPVRPDALDYYLDITGLKEQEYLNIMEKHRVEQLKGKSIPIKLKEPNQRKQIKPFIQSFIEEMQLETD
ncbi:MAG TPA: N-acetyl sugar amidotransferase [Gammaproteobacteria bacterium]|nr:N-acetyl sugar amidotransferase [Gammaproteobacteria bacterium]